MKHIVIALVSAAVASAAQPHNHHAHLHAPNAVKRDNPSPVVDYVSGPTVVVYELNGKMISEEDVKAGIANGTLVMAQNGQLSSASPSYSAPSTQAQYQAPSSSSPSAYVAPTTTSSWSSSSSSYVAPTSSSWSSSSSSEASTTSTYSSSSWSSSSSAAYSAAPSPSSYSTGSDDDDDDETSSGVETDFPDGQLSCSHFPSDYGAIPVDWMGLGGWTGIQSPGSSLGGFANIKTAISGEGCTEGSYCSYACPAGYQKAQWPSTQGATGQSVGGILCQGGKLHLTRSQNTKLCMTGASEVDIKVQNKMSGNAAVCRTDYPGTEGETVPLNTMPGQTYPLTCPNAANYYNWEGGSTSAQYYVNPMGVSVEDACQWGSSANPWGNYAPLNLGVGYSGGRAWLSIFQNAPTTTEKLDFSVEIVTDGAEGASGSCKYSNGQYCQGDSCSSTTGCTLSISGGTATFVFS